MTVHWSPKQGWTGVPSPEDYDRELRHWSSSAQRQSRVANWVRELFGDEAAKNVPERALRTAEEALELAQACRVPVETIHQLVDYVYSRPVGNAPQEIAGSMVCLYAMGAALEVDVDAEFEKEYARINTPEVIERCIRRQAEKREKFGE